MAAGTDEEGGGWAANEVGGDVEVAVEVILGGAGETGRGGREHNGPGEGRAGLGWMNRNNLHIADSVRMNTRGKEQAEAPALVVVGQNG